MKVVNIHQKVKEKQELKMAMALLKELRDYQSFMDYGEKTRANNDTIALIVRNHVEWFTA